MKYKHTKCFGICLLMAMCLCCGQMVSAKDSDSADKPSLLLWYEAPANQWVTDALPIANGNMGAMIFGGTKVDRIQFNHKTLWKGSSGATDLGSYLAFGDLYITNNSTEDIAGYRRQLDLNKAVVDVKYYSGDTDYCHEYLCSHPDNVIAVRYRAEGKSPLSLKLQLNNAQEKGTTVYYGNKATFMGRISNGMEYCAAISVVLDGGSLMQVENAMTVDGAREVIVYLTCGTTFNPASVNHLSGTASEVERDLLAVLRSAESKGYEEIRRSHESDYSNLFGRVDFVLDKANNRLPTNRMLTNTSVASANMTDMLIFQYGRYLTIASSRGIAVPSNLQGIWNKDGNATRDAVWASDIHSNINVQMNYWPAEPANLSECHLPFLGYIYNEALREDGQWQRNARDLGVGKGWVVNTAGNIFGGSSAYKLGKYSVANAWYCEHLWQHYAYTCDTTFLRDTAMPVMKSACEFWFERLVPAQNGDGTLECPYEYSPEQGFVQNATAHSHQLVTQLFEQTLKAIDVLGKEASACDDIFVATLRDKLSKIDRGLRIDKDGLIREWKYQENTPNQPADQNNFADDEHNVWQCHRHTSHLMGLYPGFSIAPNIDKDIFQAAIATLEDRGDISTGWARAWRISLWARTGNRDRTYATLRGFAHRTTNLGYDWHGGLYDNMLDAHSTSVFQIEGNFGATAGIAEMLLQSRPDSLVLLPALPSAWETGHIHGLKAIGNFEIDMDWEKGHLTKLLIRSRSGMPLTLVYPEIGDAKVRCNTSAKKVKCKTKSANRLSFATEKGAEYTIQLN